MSKILTGQELENKLTDIIWRAKKDIVIISPFIKLDNYVKKVFDKIKNKHDISLYIMFGKNQDYKHNSFSEEDLNYFINFKNVTILYNKDLHAKYYCNESEGLITSLNLYGYSMVNNIELGVNFSKPLINTIDKLYDEAYTIINHLIFEGSEVVYLKKPQYSNKLFGLKKVYQNSEVLFDITDEFFSGYYYESKKLSEFDLKLETNLDKKFDSKPQREVNEYKENSFLDREKSKIGYCIRTGEEIDFNPEKPYSYYAYKTWSQFGNYDYPENYCHKTGKESYGETSMSSPILEKSYSNN